MYKIMAAIMDPIALLNSFIWYDVHYKYSDSEICHYTSIQKDFSIFYGMSADYHKNIADSNIAFSTGHFCKSFCHRHLRG
jgi:hypothetical protein